MTNLVTKIENQDGRLVVSSRVVAEQLGKDHSKVLRTLDGLLTEPNVDSLIIESYYKDKKGEMRKEYLLTKDGFTLYMFNIQGHNDFKLAYINKFNEMERQLQSYKSVLPSSFAEALKLAYEQQLLIEQQQPKVEYYDAVLKSDKLLTSTQIAKDLGMSARKLNEILNDLGIIYKQSNTWMFFSEHQNKVPEYADYVIGENYQQLKWTEKGREWILTLLKDNDII